MALPKVNRLKSRRDFQAVFREGTRRHASHLTLRALRPSPSSKPSCDTVPQSVKTQSTKQITPAQIGISISTKVSKRAVVRNRLKRQIAAAFYQLLPKISPGWRLVVIVKPTAADIKCVTQQFLQELEQLLEQAEVFNGHS
ncbi:MAG: ribonuclease P protein component [Scytonema sp. RU_4_4]|nr:ribonuclease P protein component [Scytonema sp. RU_4_4]NJR75075.1 ribonuclease P protein component [Scytonema sp. CRU_2_7]